MIYLRIFLEFFKTGLFAIGGGYATLPFLMEMTGKLDWFTKSDLTDMIAISESTPGPIGINMSTFAGFHAAGIPGAILATFSLVLPSYIIIVIVAHFLKKFNDNAYVQSTFAAIRPMTVALITYAIYQIVIMILLIEDGTTSRIYWPAIGISVFACVLMQLPKAKKIHPILWILFGAVIGIVFKL